MPEDIDSSVHSLEPHGPRAKMRREWLRRARARESAESIEESLRDELLPTGEPPEFVYVTYEDARRLAAYVMVDTRGLYGDGSPP